MKIKKTIIADEEVRLLLRGKYKERFLDIERIGGDMSGEKSQAFYVNLLSERFVIRFNHSGSHDFRKDKVAFEKFSSKGLPIPETIEIGEFKDYHYSITTVCVGVTLDKLDTQTTICLLEKVFDVMISIHQNQPLGAGYGEWDPETFKATATTPDHMVDQVINRDLWKELESKRDFFDLEQVERLVTKLEGYREFIPDDRVLVHADYGYNNALSDGNEITGVIDWGESIYGDPLYDLAWLCLWAEIPLNANVDYRSEFSRYSIKKGLVYENYNERLDAYLLIMGISSLEIFAESDREDDYAGTLYCLENNGIKC